MGDLSKLTKAQLLDLIQQQEEQKFAILKEELGLPWDDDEEWVEYIKKLQEQAAVTFSEEETDKLKAKIAQLEADNLERNNRAPY